MRDHPRFYRVPVAMLVAWLTMQSPARAQNMLEQPGIKVSGLPGPLVLTGDATPLLVGDAGGSPAVVAAQATLGKGKLIAFGHGGFLNPKDDQADARRFLSQLASTLPRDKPVGVDRKFETLAKLLSADGFDVRRVDDAKPIAEASAAFVEESRVSADSVDAWRAYVEQGGVLVTGLPRWGWEQTHEGKAFDKEWAPCALYGAAGIHWAGGMFDKGVAFVAPAPGAVLDVSHALKVFDSESTADQKIAAGNQLQLAIGALPEHNAARKAIAARIASVQIRWPTEKEPVARDDVLNRLAILAALEAERSQPAEQVKPNPAASDFPGTVPEDARTVSRQVEVDLATPGWFVTGLYAAPGAKIGVNVEGADATAKLLIRIGNTTCNNTRHDKWTRSPRIDREWNLKPGPQTIASSFGGTIYVVVPKDLAGTRRITIEGAVEQPVFKLGVDTDESWKQSRTRPAPWAELQSPLLSISIPSQYVRGLENPTELMTWWNRVVQVQDELSPRPGFPKRGERISMDRKTCAGYMHSGYPIMTHLDVAKLFVDLDELTSKGNWGIYHEIGHNHQWRDWTFDGTGEVTNNIFSLYSFARLNPGVVPKHASPEMVQKKMAQYWRPDGPADQFKKDPIFALFMYRQVIDQFGYEPFQRFFAKAAARPENQRPKTDLEKRDRWLIDLSRETGRNLAPLMNAWGVVTSDEAKNAVKDLPPFEMRGLPEK